MDLSEYLSSKSQSQDEFAKQLGVTQGLVWQWLSARTRITAERALQIETETGGAVTRHELRPDIFGDPPAAKKAKAAA
jgi:DNA-binding transcriptional regulator YdaS (Cro superfamily)